MIDVFDKHSAQCAICKTPVDGKYRRGDKFYCASDYEKTSPEEITANTEVEREYKRHKIREGSHS